MIEEANYIDKKVVKPANTDFFGLRDEGITSLQQLSGHVWTNYNLHDPGLILLETLCYALTDLGYKSNFPLLEILKALPDDNFKLEDNAFYNKKITFASHPVTFQDYSILFLDRLGEYINNVWFETILNEEGRQTGALRVWLLARNEWSDQLDVIRAKVFECYSDRRNIGEKLSEINFLERKKAQIHVQVQIGYRISPEYIYALFLFSLEENLLNPKLKVYTEEELIKKGIPLEEIYEGPLTTRGYYNQRELSPLPRKIKIESLIQLLFELDEGVKKVTNFEVVLNDTTYSEVIDLDHFLPLFDIDDPNHVFKFYQNEELFEVNLKEAQTIYKKLRQGESRTYDLKIPKNVNNDLSEVKKRDLLSFLPVEYDLPSVFGFHRFNPSRPLRLKSEQQQLWEFLQIFNQFLSNAHQKLSNTAAFFSIYEDIYLRSIDLDSYNSAAMPVLLDRNKILDHLLSRFNIDFPGFQSVQNLNKDIVVRTLRAKEYCLQHAPEFTACRSKAANLEVAQWNTSNIPIFSKWLHLFVGFTDFTVRSTTEKVVELQKHIPAIHFSEYGFTVTEFLEAGSVSQNYKVLKKKDQFKIWLMLKGQWVYVAEEKSLNRANQKINELRKKFLKATSSSQTFHTVEDCYYDASRPFTISLYFPNWTTELKSNRLKEFIKKEVSEWLPAHIHANFYALPFDEMVALENFLQRTPKEDSSNNLDVIDNVSKFRF